MSLFAYIKRKLAKKRARRVTQEFPFAIVKYSLEQEGEIEFAQWGNPLVKMPPLTQSMVDFFRKFIKKGDLVIDIGANIGDTTVPMALAAGAEGLTLAFDPNPFVFKGLEQNARLNKGKQHIIPFRYAITVGEEEFFYVSSEASFANGGISPTRESRHGKYVFPEKIKGVNLLALLNTRYADRLERLSFIKVDAEGYDKEIIKSIRSLLQLYKPVVVAESFGPASREEKEELFEVLASLGYEIYYFDDFRSDATTIHLKTPADLSNWKKTINIYCTAKQ